ncbi:MAG TPA: hypothetical protein VKU19_15910 [Bryobacteraceae bacterium]|nr:hypothetical protein [Bryobacteraceae bacterium]
MPLLRVLELIVLVVGSFIGVVVCFAAAAAADSILNHLIRTDLLFLLALAGGLFLAGMGFALLRRHTRPRRIRYFPHAVARSKWQRIGPRATVAAPSAMVALVFFFVPFTTHLLHPGSTYLGHYHIPIPWRYAIVPIPEKPYLDPWVEVIVDNRGAGRFGFTPFTFMAWHIWPVNPRTSLLQFATRADGSIVDVQASAHEWMGVTRTKEFHLGDRTLACWQYHPERNVWFPKGPIAVNVRCELDAASNGPSFHATFDGREEDVATFYQILQGVRLVR